MKLSLLTTISLLSLGFLLGCSSTSDNDGGGGTGGTGASSTGGTSGSIHSAGGSNGTAGNSTAGTISPGGSSGTSSAGAAGSAAAGGNAGAGGTNTAGSNASGANNGGSDAGSSNAGSSNAGSSNGGDAGTGAGGSDNAGGSNAGTTSAGGSTSAGGAGSGDPELDEARVYCVDKINQYRATLSLPPYAMWDDASVCTDGEAHSDYTANTAHSAFGTCGEWAQDECPGWSGSYKDIMDGCLQMMWNEGPGEPYSAHGHYINMSNSSYTKAACGFYRDAAGTVWATQNFQ